MIFTTSVNSTKSDKICQKTKIFLFDEVPKKYNRSVLQVHSHESEVCHENCLSTKAFLARAYRDSAH